MARAGEYHLLPGPQKFTPLSSSFVLGRAKLSALVLQQEWEAFVVNRDGVIGSKARASIEVKLVPSLEEVPLNADEAYRLVVNNGKVMVEAVTEHGVYWAVQILTQSQDVQKKKVTFNGCSIVDWPAFRVRGFMQDVGCTYMSIEESKREIAVLSRLKINVFHWHLTESQSWGLESKISPILNDSMNTTRMPDKYYTLKEAKNLVAFCKAHSVLLIPEFDMPGHSAASVHTSRHDMQNPEGMKVLKLLADEVCETFDIPCLHIGTGEVQFTNPKFAPEMVAYVRTRRKRMISWNPGWHYKPDEIDTTHLWGYRGKAQKGIPAVDFKFHYFNHFDTFGDIIVLCNSCIYSVEQGSEDIAGTILATWNDHYIADKRNIILENNFYPNMPTIAGRAWRGGGTEHFGRSGTILPSEDSKVFQELTDFEGRMFWHKEHTFKGYSFAYVERTSMKWNIADTFPNGGDSNKVFPPEQELKNSYSYEEKEYGVRPAIGADIYLWHVWGSMVPAFYKTPQESHTAYAYTWVYSPKDQEVGLWAELQNCNRLEVDLVPLQGKWDYKGNHIWINDEEIRPPVWSATHRAKSNRVAPGSGNCVAHPPTLVHLNKGWNRVLLELPVGKFNIPEVRLFRWMFTTVFVTPDGENVLDRLIYSPNKTRWSRKNKNEWRRSY